MKISRIIEYIAVSTRVPITRVGEAMRIPLANQLIDTWGRGTPLAVAGKRGIPQGGVLYYAIIVFYSII